VVLAEVEAVPLAVSLGELLMNAVKHRRCSHMEAEPHAIEVEISGNGERTLIHISNCGALPHTFDYTACRGLGHGLELLSALLPVEHASLEYSQQSGWVHARLALLPPAIGVHDHTHR
jgi:two-component sensor histidine kinase